QQVPAPATQLQHALPGRDGQAVDVAQAAVVVAAQPARLVRIPRDGVPVIDALPAVVEESKGHETVRAGGGLSEWAVKHVKDSLSRSSGIPLTTGHFPPLPVIRERDRGEGLSGGHRFTGLRRSRRTLTLPSPGLPGEGNCAPPPDFAKCRVVSGVRGERKKSGTDEPGRRRSPAAPASVWRGRTDTPCDLAGALRNNRTTRGCAPAPGHGRGRSAHRPG